MMFARRLWAFARGDYKARRTENLVAHWEVCNYERLAAHL